MGSPVVYVGDGQLALFLGPVLALIALWVIIIFLGFLGTIFWVWMLVHCILNKKVRDVEKLIWILVLIFTHLLGAILYYFLVKRRKKRR